jgi:hypothetical protein
MPALSSLNLANNKFSGNIPAWASKSLSSVNLKSNQLVGGIPTGWAPDASGKPGALPALTTL